MVFRIRRFVKLMTTLLLLVQEIKIHFIVNYVSGGSGKFREKNLKEALTIFDKEAYQECA